MNREGDTYHYIAFAASPDIQVGSYLGDGAASRTVGGIGFEPAVLWIKWDGLRSAVWRSAAHPSGLSSFLDGQPARPGLITGVQPDGFVVGGDPWVNYFDGTSDKDEVYNYVAFRDAPGLLATGSYVGDGSGDRDIVDVGFQPDYVWIKRDSQASKGVHRSASVEGDSTLHFEGTANASGEIIAPLPQGFKVGPADTVNAEGDTYYWVAWKSSR